MLHCFDVLVLLISFLQKRQFYQNIAFIIYTNVNPRNLVYNNYYHYTSANFILFVYFSFSGT